MKRMNFKTGLLIILLLISFLLMNCVPPPVESEESTKAAEKEVSNVDKSKCDRYLSFAYSYYQNSDWAGTIKNYKRMFDYNCLEDYAADIFPYMGRAYLQMAKENSVYLDSALYIYQHGTEYLPERESLHESIAYIYRRQGKTDLEIREYEIMAERNPSNIEFYKTLIKLYFKVDRFDDVLWAIEKILEIDPENQEVINDRLTVYQKQGKDVIVVQQEAWENDPSTRTGLDYANALTDKMEYALAIAVLEKVTLADRNNMEAWNKLADLYKTTGDIDKSITTNIHIIKAIAPKNIDIFKNIIVGYSDMANFEEAFKWASKAVETIGSPQSYKLRGDIYYATADFNASSGKLTFEDKLVYKLAYDDYRKALSGGESSVQTRIDYLKEYLIPTSENWFMNRYNADGSKRANFRPRGDAYNWITESAKKN